MADWYYAKNGQQQGPVSSADLKRLVSSGEIGPTDLVFQEGGTSWVEANTVKGLFPGGGVANKPAPAPAPAGRGRRDEPEPAPRGRSRDDELGELPTADDDYPRRSPKSSGGMVDLLMFRVFIAPWLIIVGFWIMSSLVIVFGLLGAAFGLYSMTQNVLSGLLTLVMLLFGVPMAILYIRVICETAIIFFRQYDAIVDVRKELEKQRRD